MIRSMILATLLWVAPAHAVWRAEMAQEFAPEDGRWLRNQHVPAGNGKGNSCCNEADGTYAQEDLRGDHYWVRYHFRYYRGDGTMAEGDTDWMPVPDDAVIHDPNRHGAPVVWYFFAGDPQHPQVRCYAPGAGL